MVVISVLYLLFAYNLPFDVVDAYRESAPWKNYNIVTEKVGLIVYYSYDGYQLGFKITDTDPCECDFGDCHRTNPQRPRG